MLATSTRRSRLHDLPNLAALAGLMALSAGMGSRPALGALPTEFQDQVVTTGFSQPSGFAFLPDGRILVVEQKTAALRLVVNGVLQVSPALTVPSVNISGNERGLLGIAVDPDWPARPYVYVYYDRTPGNVNAVSRFTGSGDLADGSSAALTFADRYDILTDIPDNASNHNGGTLRFGPDGMLYASLGEDADPCAAQDSTTLKGEILRLDVSGLPAGAGGPPTKASITPADNPFTDGNANAGLVYCFGLRNPFRFTIDALTGRLYIGDVGQNSWEEVDEVYGGENLGWPHREGTATYVVAACPEPGGVGSQSYAAPIATYPHGAGSQSVIAGPLYRPLSGGAFTFPALYDGVVFFAEYYQGFIRAVRKSGGSWGPLAAVPGQPNATDWATGLTTIGDLQQGPGGAIYYLKQFPGELHRIVYTGTVTGLPTDGDSGRVLLRTAPNPLRAGRGPLRVTLVATDSTCRVDVFSLDGKLVRALFEGMPQVETTFTWDGRDDAGAPLTPGVYFVRARAGAEVSAVRVVLMP
jgi:glucose/arabinose dehydrogenase